MTTTLSSYTRFINSHVGEVAFIVGAGTSLKDADISFIHNHVVFSVNSSILLMPWHRGDSHKRYWVSNDSGVMAWDYWKLVLKSKANKVVRDSWSSLYDKFDTTDFYEFKPRPTSEDVVRPNDMGLAYCSSVPSSLDLAIQAGCSRVYLLGVDQYAQNGKSHYWQFWPRERQPKRGLSSQPNSMDNQQYAFGYNNKAYPALLDFAMHRNCLVYNCNPISRVDCFEKVNIEDVRKEFS